MMEWEAHCNDERRLPISQDLAMRERWKQISAQSIRAQGEWNKLNREERKTPRDSGVRRRGPQGDHDSARVPPYVIWFMHEL